MVRKAVDAGNPLRFPDSEGVLQKARELRAEQKQKRIDAEQEREREKARRYDEDISELEHKLTKAEHELQEETRTHDEVSDAFLGL